MGSKSTTGTGFGMCGVYRPTCKITANLTPNGTKFQSEIITTNAEDSELVERNYNGKRICLAIDSKSALLALSFWEVISVLSRDCLKALII